MYYTFLQVCLSKYIIGRLINPLKDVVVIKCNTSYYVKLKCRYRFGIHWKHLWRHLCNIMRNSDFVFLKFFRIYSYHVIIYVREKSTI